MRAVRHQESKDAGLLSVRAGEFKLAPKSRSGESPSIHHNPPLSGVRVRDRESGFVSCKKACNPLLYSSNDIESNGGE